MKCPFRTITTKSNVDSMTTKESTDFAECHYGECPYYQPEKTMPGGIIVIEACRQTKSNIRFN